MNKGYTYTEEWRRICEARYLLTLPLTQRRKELNEIEKFRGIGAVEYLKQEILKQHKYKKEYTKLT